jgi:hypothetical protein
MQALLSDPCCLVELITLGVGAIAGLSVAAWRVVHRFRFARGVRHERG